MLKNWQKLPLIHLQPSNQSTFRETSCTHTRVRTHTRLKQHTHTRVYTDLSIRVIVLDNGTRCARNGLSWYIIALFLATGGSTGIDKSFHRRAPPPITNAERPYFTPFSLLRVRADRSLFPRQTARGRRDNEARWTLRGHANAR